MAERAFLHIGQPKTGTTYLQDILWTNQAALRRGGLVLPGSGHREHLWAALDVQQRKGLAARNPRAPGTFERLCREIDAVPDGDVLLTHEFFCGATASQARAAVDRLRADEVHVVVTARHAAGLLAAGWQEMVKNGGTRDVRQVAKAPAGSEFSWQTWDLGGVLERWGTAVPPERLHVLPVPGSGATPDQLWLSFASVLGIDADLPRPDRAANPSLGPVEVELLRRINRYLGDFATPFDRGEWIRGYLAETHLRGLSQERFGLPADLLDDCRERSARAVRIIAERGHPVVGDPSTLLVPDDAPPVREPSSVQDAELVDSATRLVAAMLGDVRDLRREPAPVEPAPSRRDGLLSRWRGRHDAPRDVGHTD
ncbi:MAG: hypothetical protein Q7T71_01815 [Herbiconiux sp.]|nr:hypothetical protein [Herbiconiux sp.]